MMQRTPIPLFLSPLATQAQMNKLDEVIRQAEIGPNDHVLEIGCGWGGFAIRAAQVWVCV